MLTMSAGQVKNLRHPQYSVHV